ncbi:rod shape-determining protein MreD [Mangrovimonas sp. YM274]|uniref:rod shape-determining protein MreD n=1 Tax=Mangrovimonas sp. YM274 TaxID=3070660 RepID=UPI0027DC2A0C|nr:rod shape-determining protein MreD [Mangrovimonas sp. YM274]WMI68319.1 rod shape-determining protein MreD [Mangrovimonas sp. YM274]
MNNRSIYTFLQFFTLVLVQVLVLNNVNFLEYINPYPYILFILLFPVRANRSLIIFLSFLLGLIVDIFSDSGGIHAAASVTLAFIRPAILKFSFGMIYEHQSIKFSQTEFGRRLVYFSIATAIHHFIMFSLEVFNISKIILVLQKTLFSSIFTIILSLLITVLFSRKRR